jgi:hypothetical protein
VAATRQELQLWREFVGVETHGSPSNSGWITTGPYRRSHHQPHMALTSRGDVVRPRAPSIRNMRYLRRSCRVGCIPAARRGGRTGRGRSTPDLVLPGSAHSRPTSPSVRAVSPAQRVLTPSSATRGSRTGCASPSVQIPSAPLKPLVRVSLAASGSSIRAIVESRVPQAAHKVGAVTPHRLRGGQCRIPRCGRGHGAR